MIDDSSRSTLRLVPVGDVDERVLAWLASELQATFVGVRCTITRTFAPRREWPGGVVGRPDADAVLDALIDWHVAERMDLERDRILGVTDLDLAAPHRSCVFGRATVGGCCALIGLARLRTSEAEEGEALAFLRVRMLKEAVHEVGHLAGLGHCDRQTCVMFPSPDLPATDAKSSEFCSACAARIAEPLHVRE